MNRRRRCVGGMAGIGLVLVVLGGCVGIGRLDPENTGRTLAYEPGVPNFDLEAVATVRDGQPGVDLYLGVPYMSLVFLPDDSLYEASFETLTRVYHDGKLTAEHIDADTVRVPTFEATLAFEPYTMRRRIDLPPGSYRLDVTLTDAESGEQVLRRQRVEVVDAGTTRPVLSRLRIEARRDGRDFEPLVSLNVPAGLDSLRAVVMLYNADRLGAVDVAMHLLRFPSDTTTARPPYLFDIRTPLSLIRYDKPDTLQVTRRRLYDLNDELEIYFNLPSPDLGIHRVEVAVRGVDESETELYQKRDLAVRSASFPHIATLDEMIEALTYIADVDELEAMREAETPAERKRLFDAFWGSIIPDRQVAANLLKLYYSRVEEANLRFTSYKEGWKTDQGMIFIILGNPLYVENRIDHEIWRYARDENEPLGVFVFERHHLYASDGLFDALLLNREVFRDSFWHRAIERWRRGTVL